MHASTSAGGWFGLGSDVDHGGYFNDTQAKNSSGMIMLADSKPKVSFDCNMDPRNPIYWPSNLHERWTCPMFADGHAEAAFRKLVIDPVNKQRRRRWSNDLQ